MRYVPESHSLFQSILDFFASLQFTQGDTMGNILVGLIWLLIGLILIALLLVLINLIVWFAKGVYHLTLTYQIRQLDLIVTNKQANKDETILLPIGVNDSPVIVPLSVSGPKNVTLYSPDLNHSFTINDSNYVIGDVLSCKVAIGQNRRHDVKHMYIKSHAKV